MGKLDLKEILREVLIANDIPEEKFSLDGFKEDTYCMEKSSNGYIVYEALGENKCGLKTHARLLYACYDMINRVSTINCRTPEIISTFVNNVILQALEELGIED